MIDQVSMLNPMNDSSISNHRNILVKKRIRSSHSQKPSKPNPKQPLRHPRLTNNQRQTSNKQKNKVSKNSLKKKSLTPSRPNVVTKSRSKSKVVVEKKKALSKLKELEEDISSLQSKIVSNRQDVLKREIKQLKL